MVLLAKIALLFLNILIIIQLAATKWYSTAIFFIFIFFYQLYLYRGLKKTREKSHFNYRIKIFTFIIQFIIIAIISRMINLQLLNGKEYREKETQQISSSVVKRGDRGTIYDSNIKKMAFNVNVYNIIIDPTKIDDDPNLLKVFHELKKMGYIKGEINKLIKELVNLSETGSRYKVVRRRISEEDKKIIELLIKENKLKRNLIFFEKILERQYFKNTDYQKIIGNIGYLNNEPGVKKIGNFGVEKQYESYLKEKELSVRSIYSKSRDIKLPTSQETIERSLNGKNIIMTIDTEINEVLNKELKKQYDNVKAEEAYALVMDPNTGKILAISYYTRNNKSLRNPIFQDQFEPGSIFKPLIIAAAYEEGYINDNTKIDVGDGTLRRYNHTIKEASRGTRGILTPGEIINKSSNVGMSLISEKFSEKLFEEYLIKFGFYEKTGVDFPGELTPRSVPYKRWDKLKKYTMSYGQGIALTPIQVATAFSATINGGILYKPYIVERVEEQNGIVIMRNTPKERRRVISPEVSEKIKIMMENNVKEGSGRRAVVNGYRIGGKTGTAQISTKGGYLKGEYLSSFIGMFPVEEPQYVILVMLLKPQGEALTSRFGSSVAAPVFGEVVASITKTKGLASEDVKSISINSSGEKIENLKVIEEKFSLEQEIMPNLIGKTQREILEIFEGSHYIVEIKGTGKVINQTPKSKEVIKSFEKVKIELK